MKRLPFFANTTFASGRLSGLNSLLHYERDGFDARLVV